MTTYDVGAAAGSLCGLLMVVGGMILLYTGAVSLNTASKDEAASLEFRRLFRLTTHYPALGLFVIGLAFILTSTILSRPPDNRISITASLAGLPAGEFDPQSLKLSLESSLAPSFDPDSDTIAVDGDPTEMWKIVITYPGFYAEKPVDAKGKKNITLGKISLLKVAEKPPVNQANIAPLPPEFKASTGGL